MFCFSSFKDTSFRFDDKNPETVRQDLSRCFQSQHCYRNANDADNDCDTLTNLCFWSDKSISWLGQTMQTQKDVKLVWMKNKCICYIILLDSFLISE